MIEPVSRIIVDAGRRLGKPKPENGCLLSIATLQYNAAMDQFHGTTVLSVRRQEHVAIAGDGQVTMDKVVAKADAVKVRRIDDVGGENAGVLLGFAGAAADAFSLLDKFEAKLRDSPANIKRAAIELAKQWRTDRVLRNLESLLVAADRSCSLIISGSGEVIEPSDGVVGIGSGGPYAVAAARALLKHSEMPASNIVRHSMEIAGDLCIYTNKNITVLNL